MASNSFFFFFYCSLALVFFAITPTSHSLPYIFFHGLEDECSSNISITTVAYLNEVVGVQGQCVEIGNGRVDAWAMPLTQQIEIACGKVKELEYLKDGYNIFGVSQGTLIGRGVIEFCDDAPPVRNFISLAGPHAGVASIPFCEEIDACSGLIGLIELIVYTPFVQNLFTPASFYKSPTRIEEYLANSIFLPRLNNERPDARNSTYKERFSSLEKLVLIMNDNDTIVVPKESSWFGYYQDGGRDIILPADQTDLYIEDWIGLKTLTESGRVINLIAPGVHANLDPETVLSKYVAPYLFNDEAKEEEKKKHPWSII